jgi:hypothetical protein
VKTRQRFVGFESLPVPLNFKGMNEQELLNLERDLKKFKEFILKDKNLRELAPNINFNIVISSVIVTRRHITGRAHSSENTSTESLNG